MKKFVPYALLLFTLLMSCSSQTGDSDYTSINSSSELHTSYDTTSPSSSLDNPSSLDTPSSVVDDTPSSNYSSIDTPSSDDFSNGSSVTANKKTISEIVELAASLEDDEEGPIVTFEGIYLRYVTHGSDKMMLFADATGENYLYVRVEGGFDNFLKNRYLNCYYRVKGKVKKGLNVAEVIYQSLENVTSNPEQNYSYTKLTQSFNTIGDLYQEIGQMSLDKKYSAIGKIVSFEGRVVATDRSDANKKAFVYDGKNVIAVIDDKKICSTDAIGNNYSFIGLISVLKSSPAIMMLSSNLIVDETTHTFDYSSAVEKLPSGFSSWYYVGDKINPPSIQDYGKLYKITGYVADDESRTQKYNFGLTDNSGGDLSDTGVKTSINGVYFLNHLSLDERDLEHSVFTDYYTSQEKISLYVVLHQFDTNNHGWKVVPLESTIEVVE